MIKGITHDENGNPKVRRSVTTKLAIGLAPGKSGGGPKKLDHIAFLKKEYVDREIIWVEDRRLTEHYSQDGKQCRELWITFLDDDIEQVFPTSYGAYVTRGRWCRGDGETAQRRPNHDKEWNDFQPYKGPCANGGCPFAENGKCKPNGTLYFFLQDFPTLGSLCKLQTTGYQSIAQISSALQDLRAVTGGRLMGVSAKLFVHPDKTVYEQNGQTKTGTKWVWGLQLAAADLRDMGAKMLEATRTFTQIKGELSGRVLEIDEQEEEVAAEMTAEFYPEVAGERKAEVITQQGGGADIKFGDEIEALLTSIGVNQANRRAIVGGVPSDMGLEKLAGILKEIVDIFSARGEKMRAAPAIQKNHKRLPEYLIELKEWQARQQVSPERSRRETAVSATPSRAKNGAGSGEPSPAAEQPDLLNGTEITDADVSADAVPAQQRQQPATTGRFTF